MDETIAKEWVEKLNSGLYKQGFGGLRMIEKGEEGEECNSFCCLGVLCDLAKEKGVAKWERIDERHGYYSSGVGEDLAQYSGGYLPKVVRDWAGMKNFNGDDGRTSLSSMNDNFHTFEDIAAHIQKNWDKL